MEREDISNPMVEQEINLEPDQKVLQQERLEKYCQDYLEKDKEEPLLNEEIDKINTYCFYPVHPKYEPIYKAYNDHMSMFWRPSEIQFQEDARDWEKKLNDHERNFLKYVLAFFAQSDGIVSENVSTNFGNEVIIPQARAFYSFQNFIEYVHSEMYSLMIDVFVKNEEEKNFLYNAVKTMPIIQKKANWMMKWMDQTKAPFALRLLAFSIVEGIFFSGSFCAIFWIRTKKILPGLRKSNDFISRDESVHTQFAVLLYTQYVINKVPEDIVKNMFQEAIELEIEYINEALKIELLGMNKKDMAEYVKYCGDILIQQMGYSKIYNAKQPFEFMKSIDMEIKQNFFENRATEYQIAGIGDEDDDGEF